MSHDIPEPGLAPGDLHDLSSLYAVDALDPAERAAFETHLADCPPCRAEVARYAETTAQLAAAVAQEPPPALRTSVLDAIHGTLPLPARPDTATATPAAQPAAGNPERQLAKGPREDRARSDRGSHVSLDALRRRYRRVLVAAVSTALVPGVLAGGWGLGVQAEQRHQEQLVAQEQDRENGLLAASDVTTRSLDVGGRAGTLFVSREQNTALFVSDELPDPGDNSEYQLWLMDGDTPVPDAHFTGGQLRTWLTGDVADADAVAMTIEPAGGSTTPTLPLVASTEI
ncbi:anti-sigma factor [Kocuria sp. cx-116]|uniref:anti-sigma factor n=1 Tax=Kocuria sp. cx-116 TaxID=2771378 RepID=UPI0016876486|nr:anti-sigma factor [Kocuria sp. cx-116]MBD2763309.1 anti-sigma factor [Kocuria sp. cx-116]